MSVVIRGVLYASFDDGPIICQLWWGVLYVSYDEVVLYASYDEGVIIYQLC